MTITESIETQVLKNLRQPKIRDRRSEKSYPKMKRGSHRNVQRKRAKSTIRVLDSGNWEFI